MTQTNYDQEIRIKLKDHSAFLIKGKDKVSALKMKLDVEDMAINEFIDIFVEDVEKHWNKKTVPTKFPWDLSWEEDLKDDIWHELYNKLQNWKGNEVKKTFGYSVASLTPARWFNKDVKEEGAKLLRDGVAIKDSMLILRNDTKEARDYWGISKRFTDILRKETEKEFLKTRHEAKKRYTNQAELAEIVFYQYIRHYLMGILLSKLSKQKSGAVVTSENNISLVTKDTLDSKRLNDAEDGKKTKFVFKKYS